MAATDELEGVLLQREQELEHIDAALASARAGSGRALLIEGPAGIGKTTLAEAARRRARPAGMLVLHGRGTELERDYALGVACQCLQPAVQAADAHERRRLLSGAAGRVAPVLLDGVPEPDGAAPFAMLHGLYWLVANLTATAPVLLVVDDVQWVDEPSLRFLAFLVRRVEELPLAMLLASRVDDELLLAGTLAEARADPALEVLSPTALGDDAVAALLAAGGEEVVAAGFAHACRQATDGNPFLLHHLAAQLRAEGVPFTAEAAGRVAHVTPPEVARSVRRQLAQLDADQLAVLRAVAILGDNATISEIGAFAELGRAIIVASAEQLSAAGLFADGRPVRFRHPLLRGAATSSMTALDRDRGHRRAAKLLAERGAPVERQAVHLRMVEPEGSADVAAVLRQAARGARDRGAPDQAAALLQRAVAEPPPVALRHELLLELADAEYAAGHAERTREHASDAHRLAPDASGRGHALHLWGAAMRPDLEAMASLAPLVDRAMEELADVDRELALQLRSHAMETVLVAPPDPGREARLVRGAADLGGTTPGEAAVLGMYVLLRAGQDDATAAEVGELAERAATQSEAWLVSAGPDVLAFAGVTFCLRWSDRLDLAQRLLVASVEQSRRRGLLPSFVLTASGLSAVRRRRGMLRDAEADARAGIIPGGPEWTVVQAGAAVAASLLDQGRPAAALQVLTDHGLLGPIGPAPPLTDMLLTRMRVRAALGETEAALADWKDAIARPVRGYPRVCHIEDHVVVAELLRAAGDGAGARALAEEALEIARRWGTSGAIGEALRGVARAGSGGDEAIDLLRDAVAHLERSPALLVRARALVDLGAALRRRGGRRDAREPLREGMELARACSADGLAELARGELAASGVRVRRRTPEGADLLTASEQRIAELAAAGASNAEIAQSLFVTVKTVEMHLTHAYRKLNITSRAKLPQVLLG